MRKGVRMGLGKARAMADQSRAYVVAIDKRKLHNSRRHRLIVVLLVVSM